MAAHWHRGRQDGHSDPQPCNDHPARWSTGHRDGNPPGRWRQGPTQRHRHLHRDERTQCRTVRQRGHRQHRKGVLHLYRHGTDIVVASVPTAYTVGPLQSNQTSILWTNDTTQVWSGADIGNPALAGSDSLSNGTWTISGSGTDIGGTADQFHFVWQPL